MKGAFALLSLFLSILSCKQVEPVLEHRRFFQSTTIHNNAVRIIIEGNQYWLNRVSDLPGDSEVVYAGLVRLDTDELTLYGLWGRSLELERDEQLWKAVGAVGGAQTWEFVEVSDPEIYSDWSFLEQGRR